MQIDDDLTDLSWLVHMNNPHPKARSPVYHSSSHESKTKKSDRISKPLTVVNGQSTLNRSSTSRSFPKHYSNEENQYTSSSPPSYSSNKRKYDVIDSSHCNKRFHAEQTLPVYPMASDYFYYDQASSSNSIPRTSVLPSSSRYMLLRNDPSLADTLPTLPVSNTYSSSNKLLEDENLYADDIEHLLDIFKNEVEMIGLDPVASTSTGDLTLDMAHCLSSNEFCTY